MTSEQPVVKYRKDYQPPRYLVDTVDLRFELDPEKTKVLAKLAIRPNPDRRDQGPLVLDGEELELTAIRINGEDVPEELYTVADEALTIQAPDVAFTLETEVEISPATNTALSGLYLSSGNYCTQCEAEGFRRITYFPDRPDVMSTFTTTIVGDPDAVPVMLSNGNRTDQGTTDDGRAWVRWEDPFRKPSYLFALVAGRLEAHTGTFTTMSGREVRLEIWVEPQNIDKCEHALASLQRSMKWDEETFGLEYDLDIYMIVAVGDFNMGAMENKGLNVFNAKYVLAKPETATDSDYEHIEGVIGHEYFHNWTGNRVTCRDWFQLTLKEGLTVFRDQQFTADMTSAAVKRISDVRYLRAAQFDEDAGPMAHPIRPDAYVEMNNFYTATVYIKGAEIIRLYHQILGADGFRRGMDLYFERHDGQAVTCDDFRNAMADANEVDLSTLDRWYSQAGTPVVSAASTYEDGTLTLHLRQSRPPLNDLPDFEPVPIPVRTALLGKSGERLSFHLDGPALPGDDERETLLMLTEREQTFTFENVEEKPVLSLLRGFSAPVKLEEESNLDLLSFRFAKDDDPLNRWDAGQRLFEDVLLRLVRTGDPAQAQVEPKLVQAFGEVLDATDLDGSLKALAMQIPGERMLVQKLTDVDPDILYAARRRILTTLSDTYFDKLLALYRDTRVQGPHSTDRAAVDRRSLANACLALACTNGRPEALELTKAQFDAATNMTDAEAALFALSHHPGALRDSAVEAFYAKWQDDPLVVDKWFTAQAMSRADDALDRIEALFEHPAFSLRNPNRTRSLIGAFAAANLVKFHDPSERGYRLLERTVKELDASNPQVAARLVGSFNSYKRFEPKRREAMKRALERIRAGAKSKDVIEIVDRALAS